jgi:tRNA pseudouridine55 synthase
VAEHVVPFGIWLVDKPAGPTSHDVVAGIRKQVGKGVRVGHSGTLDPFATGLLVVLIGKATRLVQFLTLLDKTYRARVRLGATSQTGDPEGPIEPTGAPLPDLEEVRRAVADLPGQHRQLVPALAAVKIDGEPLYRRTRRGEDVERPERDITITHAELVDEDLADGWIDVEVTCSKGTYIRQLATDLGEALGCGGYCEQLRRLTVGGLSVDDAVATDRVRAVGGIDPRRALAPMPTRSLDPQELIDVGHGRLVSGEADGPVMLVTDEALVAIAYPGDAGTLRPRIVLT